MFDMDDIIYNRRQRRWLAVRVGYIIEREAGAVDKLPTVANETHVIRRSRKYTFGSDNEERTPSMLKKRLTDLKEMFKAVFVLTNQL